jgi:hypothetical protein
VTSAAPDSRGEQGVVSALTPVILGYLIELNNALVLGLVRTPYKTMNREWVVFNLRGAQDELGRTIREIESHPDYDYGEFLVAMSHAYHHINTAWNAREEPAATVEGCTEQDFYRWRRFPTDIELGS